VVLNSQKRALLAIGADRAMTRKINTEKELLEVVTQLRPELLGLLFKYTGNRWDAEELLGDVVLELLQLTAQQRSDIQSLPKYCYKVARNKGRDWLRRQRIVTFEPYTDEQHGVGTDQRPPVDRIAMAEQGLALLNRVVRSLPSRCREIFMKKYEIGLSSQEIAIEFKIKLSTVKDHLSKAKAKIKLSLVPISYESGIGTRRNQRRRKSDAAKDEQS